MRLVADICPGCGARIQVDADAEQAQCSYCSATYRLGDAAKDKQAAEKLAALQRFAAAQRLAAEQAKRASPARWLVPLGIVIALVVFALVPSSGGNAGSTPPVAATLATSSAAVPEEELPAWLPHRQAILVDVTGDGLKDPIGWARYYRQPGTPQHLVALDAASGKRVWQSDAFSPEGWGSIKVALVDDALLVADTAGLLRSIATATGKTRWSVPLGERVRRICKRTESGVLINLDDDRAVEVALATGGLTPRGEVDRRERDCETFRSGEVGEDPEVHVASPSTLFGGRANLEGLDTYLLLMPTKSTLWFALGVRKPGASLPTVAGFNRPEKLPEPGLGDGDYKALWKASIAGTSPGAAVEQPPAVSWFIGGHVFASYSTTSTPPVGHLVCLDGTTGANVYDVALPDIDGNRLDGLSGADGRLYLTHSKGLDVFDAKTGGRIAHLSD